MLKVGDNKKTTTINASCSFLPKAKYFCFGNRKKLII